jgi:hypothetical protein
MRAGRNRRRLTVVTEIGLPFSQTNSRSLAAGMAHFTFT